MSKYSIERRASILKRLLPPHNLTVAEVARQEGISVPTLYNWRNQAKEQGLPVPGKSKSTAEWSAEAKFAVVVATAAMSAAELNAYCREKGLFPEQVKDWKAECLQGFVDSKVQRQQLRQQARSDQSEIKRLNRELRLKDRALAEATALLVLRKKLRAFYGEDPEGE